MACGCGGRGVGAIAPGGAHLAMHWGSSNLSSPGANLHTLGIVDPVSGQPELKHAAVQVEKYTAGKSLVVMRRSEADADGKLQPNPLAVMDRLRQWLPHFPYASLTLSGRNSPVVVLKARGEELSPELIEALDREIALDDPTRVLSYQDSRKDVAKRAGVSIKTASRVLNDHPSVAPATRKAALSRLRTCRRTYTAARISSSMTASLKWSWKR